MPHVIECLRRLSLLAALTMVPLASMAEPGIGPNEILLGQTIGVTGPVASQVKEMLEGAKIYFDAVNKSGGINGRKVRINTVDDGFDPKRALENAKGLVEKDNVFALFFVRGTAHTEAMLPYITEKQVPVFAPFTGAMTLHEPANPWLFNLRAPYQREVRHAINYLNTIGIARIGAIYAEDAYGRDGMIGFNAGLGARNLKPTVVTSFKRPMGDVTAQIEALAKSDAQALFVIASGAEAVKIIRGARAKGSRAQMIVLSNNAAKSFVDELAADGRGVIVTQVMPDGASPKTTIAREYIERAKQANITPTTAGIEAYIAAKVFSEGLKRAGRNPTRRSLVTALESMTNYDIGGVSLGYGPGDRTGMDFVEISIISSAGRMVR